MIRLILGLVCLAVWLRALIDYDGSKPDTCEDCDPDHCPFPCEKNMR